MPTLIDCQISVRDLVLGDGTPYRLLGFNPWVRTIRHDQQPRAWNHGAWSGAEWIDPTIVPIRVHVRGADRSFSGWLTAQQQLAAAFAAIGDTDEQVELRWRLDGAEYVMFGRPRLVEPDIRKFVDGLAHAFTQCAFVALDPRIYSGELHTTAAISLPSYAGGLLAPLLAPFYIGGTLIGGQATLVNAGTADTGLLLRIDGPVDDPRVTLQRPDGLTQILTFDVILAVGQFILVDTAARTAYLNGLETSSVRGLTAGEFPILPPGTSTLRFNATDFATGTLTVTWRDAWF